MVYSVVMPVYNVANYVIESLQSCLVQRLVHPDEIIDIVIVNDGSSDDSLSLVCDYLKDKNTSFFIITQKNGALSSARNTGLEFIKNTPLREFFDFIFENNLQSNFQQEAIAYFENTSLLESICIKNGIDFLKFNESREGILKLIKKVKIISKNIIEIDMNNILEFFTQELPNNNFIHFLDSDDILHKDCFYIMSEWVSKYDLDMFWHGYIIFDDSAGVQSVTPYTAGAQADMHLNLENATRDRPLNGIDLLAFYTHPYRPHLSWVWKGGFKASTLNKDKKHLRFIHEMEAEDITFGVYLVTKSDRIKVVFQVLLYYRVRSNSISGISRSGGASEYELPTYLKRIAHHFNSKYDVKLYYWGYCHMRAALVVYEYACSHELRHITYERKMMIKNIALTKIIIGIDCLRLGVDPLNAKYIFSQMKEITDMLPKHMQREINIPLKLYRKYKFLKNKCKYFTTFIIFIPYRAIKLARKIFSSKGISYIKKMAKGVI